MKSSRIFTFLVILFAGCGTPPFVAEGPTSRPLSDFARIEAKVLDLALGEASKDWILSAKAFSKNYREPLYFYLHKRKILDAAEGPALIIEGRILRYQGELVPGPGESNDQTRSTIEVQFVFKDEAGSRLGGGKVTANDTQMNPRDALHGAEKRIIASLVKYIRKAMGHPAEKEIPEPEVTP